MAALVLTAAVVGAQVAYPLLSGSALTAITIITVLAFAFASLASAAAASGARTAVALALAAGGTGLAAEAVGVATGLPFGSYSYTRTLGPQVLGVPLVVPAAWLMMAWPTLVAGRRLAAAARWPRWAAVPLAALALTSWDLSLDPQMVAAGHWRWAHPTPSLPGIGGIPATNTAGWLLVSLVIHALLHRAVPHARATAGIPRAEVAPAVLLGWTWLGSTLANAAFFDRPGVAGWTFVAMGVVVGPYLAVLAAAGARQRAQLREPAGAPARR